MEELFLQQNQFGQFPLHTKLNDLGQSWQDINQGMRKTLFLQQTNSKTNSKFSEEILKNRSNNFLNKSQSYKQFHLNYQLKLKNNQLNVCKKQLKIARSITQSNQLKLNRKSSAEEHYKQNFVFNQTGNNMVRLNGITDRIINDLTHQDQIVKNSSLKNRQNYSQQKHKYNLGAIKEEHDQNSGRNKMKSQAVKIKSFDVCPINHSSAFVSRFISKESIQKPLIHLEQKHYSLNKYDRLPILKIQNNFQRNKNSSLSIHALNYNKQKIYLLHRLSKNKYELKREKQKQPILSKQQSGMGIKKYKLVLNPRLSKLKLFN